MANLSDIIEEFILNAFGENGEAKLSRNELAGHFSVAPSQINYVLSTRFTPDRGYVIETKRGGGGGVVVYRISQDGNTLFSDIAGELAEISYFTYNKAKNIVVRLYRDGLVTEAEGELMLAALKADGNIDAKTASGLRKETLMNMLKVVLKNNR